MWTDVSVTSPRRTYPNRMVSSQHLLRTRSLQTGPGPHESAGRYWLDISWDIRLKLNSEVVGTYNAFSFYPIDLICLRNFVCLRMRCPWFRLQLVQCTLCVSGSYIPLFNLYSTCRMFEVLHIFVFSLFRPTVLPEYCCTSKLLAPCPVVTGLHARRWRHVAIWSGYCPSALWFIFAIPFHVS